jgi:hypothetical protein
MGMFFAIAVGFAIGGALLAVFRWGMRYYRRRAGRTSGPTKKLGWVARSLIVLFLIGVVAFAVSTFLGSKEVWLFRVGKAIYERDGDSFVELTMWGEHWNYQYPILPKFGGWYLLKFLEPEKYGKLSKGLMKCWAVDSQVIFDNRLWQMNYGHRAWSNRSLHQYVPCGYEMQSSPGKNRTKSYRETVRKIISDPKRLNIPSPWWLLRNVKCGASRATIWPEDKHDLHISIIDCVVPLPDGSKIAFSLQGKSDPKLYHLDVIALWNHFDSKFYKFTTKDEANKQRRWVSFDENNKLKATHLFRTGYASPKSKFFWAKCPCKKPKPIK